MSTTQADQKSSTPSIAEIVAKASSMSLHQPNKNPSIPQNPLPSSCSIITPVSTGVNIPKSTTHSSTNTISPTSITSSLLNSSSINTKPVAMTLTPATSAKLVSPVTTTNVTTSQNQSQSSANKNMVSVTKILTKPSSTTTTNGKKISSDSNLKQITNTNNKTTISMSKSNVTSTMNNSASTSQNLSSNQTKPQSKFRLSPSASAWYPPGVSPTAPTNEIVLSRGTARLVSVPPKNKAAPQTDVKPVTSTQSDDRADLSKKPCDVLTKMIIGKSTQPSVVATKPVEQPKIQSTNQSSSIQAETSKHNKKSIQTVSTVTPNAANKTLGNESNQDKKQGNSITEVKVIGVSNKNPATVTNGPVVNGEKHDQKSKAITEHVKGGSRDGITIVYERPSRKSNHPGKIPSKNKNGSSRNKSSRAAKNISVQILSTTPQPAIQTKPSSPEAKINLVTTAPFTVPSNSDIKNNTNLNLTTTTSSAITNGLNSKASAENVTPNESISVGNTLTDIPKAQVFVSSLNKGNILATSPLKGSTYDHRMIPPLQSTSPVNPAAPPQVISPVSTSLPNSILKNKPQKENKDELHALNNHISKKRNSQSQQDIRITTKVPRSLHYQSAGNKKNTTSDNNPFSQAQTSTSSITPFTLGATLAGMIHDEGEAEDSTNIEDPVEQKGNNNRSHFSAQNIAETALLANGQNSVGYHLPPIAGRILMFAFTLLMLAVLAPFVSAIIFGCIVLGCCCFALFSAWLAGVAFITSVILVPAIVVAFTSAAGALAILASIVVMITSCVALRKLNRHFAIKGWYIAECFEQVIAETRKLGNACMSTYRQYDARSGSRPQTS